MPSSSRCAILHTKDHPFLAAREGQLYLRGGLKRQWLMDDLQSFTPLRFMPPELMGYQGRAIVIDPDVFAVGDVHELLTRDMQGKALMCRARKGPKGLASSVMLLDCAKLGHWRCAEQFEEMFAFRRDYMEWISLKLEPREHIGLLEPAWNDFDHLGAGTKLLHNTKRWNQPWKTGLPVDFTPSEKTQLFAPLGWFRRARAALFGRYGGARPVPPAPRPQAGALLLRPAARMPREGRDHRGDAARGDGAQPRPPRRLRGHRADPAARRLGRPQQRPDPRHHERQVVRRRAARPAEGLARAHREAALEQEAVEGAEVAGVGQEAGSGGAWSRGAGAGRPALARREQEAGQRAAQLVERAAAARSADPGSRAAGRGARSRPSSRCCRR